MIWHEEDFYLQEMYGVMTAGKYFILVWFFFYLKFKHQKQKTKSPFEARQCKIISLTPITKPHQQKMFLYTQELLQTGNEQSKS